MILRVFQQPSMEEDDRASDDYSIDSESHFTEGESAIADTHMLED